MGCICDVIKLKRSVKVVPKSAYKRMPPSLTQDQIAVIRNNWNVLKMHFGTVGVNIFICLFESRPEIMETFKEFQGKELKELRVTGLLRKHSLRVMTTIDNCVLHANDLPVIIPYLTDLGMRHAKYDVPIEYLECILSPFLKTIKPFIEDHWNDDLESAWKSFFAWILYFVKDGMLKKCEK